MNEENHQIINEEPKEDQIVQKLIQMENLKKLLLQKIIIVCNNLNIEINMIEQDFIIGKGHKKFMSVKEQEMNLISELEVNFVTMIQLLSFT